MLKPLFTSQSRLKSQAERSMAAQDAEQCKDELTAKTTAQKIRQKLKKILFEKGIENNAMCSLT